MNRIKCIDVEYHKIRRTFKEYEEGRLERSQRFLALLPVIFASDGVFLV